MQRFFVSRPRVSLIQKLRGVFLLVHVLLFPKSQHLRWSKQHFLAPKRVILGNRRHKTAHQPAEWASIEKPKASKVPHNIENLWFHWIGSGGAQNKGANIGVAQQNADFWAKNPVFVDKNPSFLEINQIFCNHHGGTPKRQHSCVDFVVRRALRRPSGPFLARQYAFITKPQPFSHHFLRSGGSDSMGS